MRGYIVIIHGGGATGITQTNDTDLHQHQRRLYTEKEMAEMLRLARINPGKMPSAMVEHASFGWLRCGATAPSTTKLGKGTSTQAQRTRWMGPKTT